MKLKKRICKNICIMLLSVFLLNGCKTEPVEENDATEYSEAIYTCEAVEDITQEEIVCFDNLLVRYFMSRSWRVERESVGVFYHYLFVFEDGSVYCGTEQFRHGSVVRDLYNCNDTGWSNMEDVYYLGKFSGEDLWEINYFIECVDYSSEEIDYHEVEYDYNNTEGNDCANLNQKDWNSMSFSMLYENEEGDLEVFYVEGRTLENGQEDLGYQTTDQNALALMDFVEESPFYTTWLELIFEEAE